MGAVVVHLVEVVVLGVGRRDEARLVVEEDHVDAVGAAARDAHAGHAEVALPVEAEGVAAVGDGADDELLRVVGAAAELDHLGGAFEDGGEVIRLYKSLWLTYLYKDVE